uniref:Pentatricopeptide repeat-containing protein n=1 Tax=Zea mays TaxID=4577 RepID=A0A804LEU5_MAIZE
MPDKKIEGADSSHIVSSTKSLESSVGPNLIESTDGDYCNNLHKTAVANFVASMLQEHPMSLILAENKSNLQEISVEQKIPIFVSINLSPKVDGSELPCPIEVHDGITSSSSKTNEPMEAQDYSNTMKSNTASCMFEASKRQECPISLILADKKGSLQEVSVEQNVPCGDYVALSQKADGSELTSTREAPEGFLTSSSKVYVLKEAQDGSITTEASKVNVCAASHSMLRLIEGVQDEASCIDSDKVTCETPPAILKKLKEDKPLVVHRFHKHQMSLGDTHQKVPAPVSRSNTSKYLRMDKNIVDTTTPIESVKAVASKFGGSMNWKTRKTQTAQQVSDRIVLELDKLKNEISECKHQAEAAEAAKLSVLKELERTKKLIDEMKHVLEREQAEEVDAKDDLELFQIILQAMEGVDCNDSVVVREKLNNIQERHKALDAKVISVKYVLGKVQEDYDSLLIGTDISINKAQAAFTMSKGAEKEVEELTIELQRLKEVFDLANAKFQDVEERKNTLMARDEDRLAWEEDLRQSDKELNQISMDLCSFQELQSKHDTSATMLLNLKNEVANYLEAKRIEEAREQESGTHKPVQEVIIMLKSELVEQRKSIARVTDELCVLKATAELLKSQLKKEKAALAAAQQMEVMASMSTQSLKMDIKLSQQELEALHAKAKECRDRSGKALQDASHEADEAKVIATKAQGELKKTEEEVAQAKAALSTVESKLEAVLRDIQAAKASERLALDTLTTTTLEEHSKVGARYSETVTLDLDEYTSLVQRSRQAEEAAHEKTTAASTAEVEAAKESAARTISRLNEILQALEEQKQALAAATERAGRASEGKLAMEQELRQRREEENGKRRRMASEAPKPVTGPRSAAEIAGRVDMTLTCTGKGDSSCPAASVHPVSDASGTGTGRSSPSDAALPVPVPAKTKKAKKLPFFTRVVMFLGGRRRRRLRAAR